jgi:hypothetical protein
MFQNLYKFIVSNKVNNELFQVESFTPEVEVRAVLESQFLARLMYAKLCGLQIGYSFLQIYVFIIIPPPQNMGGL